MRICSRCGIPKVEDAFRLRKSMSTGRHYRGKICQACHNAKALIWRKNNPTLVMQYNLKQREKNRPKDRLRARNHALKRKFGITLEDKNWLLHNQDNQCLICGTQNPQSKRPWHVDHDHKTGKIRSVLCNACNLMIGFAKENPATLRMAAKYLEYHNAN